MQATQERFPATQTEHAAEEMRKTGFRGFLAAQWRWIVVLGSLAFGTAVSVVLIETEPAFYTYRTADLDPQEQAELSKAFVNKATRLMSDMQSATTWTAEFDETHINAWLADDFEINHAKQTLPEGISTPRIEIEDDEMRIGFRYENRWISTVIQIGLRCWVPRRDVIALQFDRAWCGKFPLPTAYTMQLIEDFAHSHSMEVTWKRRGRSLVALLELPREHRGMQLLKVEIKDDAIRFKGTAGRFAYPAADFAPSAN